MTKSWFASNFCPTGAICSDTEGELIPSNGPKIRTMHFTDPPHEPFIATVRAFSTQERFVEAGTFPADWLPCEGQLVDIFQYIDLYPYIGTNYGGEGRATFGIPDLRNTGGNYYICFKGAKASWPR